MKRSNIKIGILAIQGGYLEHRTAFNRCMLNDEFLGENLTLDVVEIRSANDLTPDLDGIILPGGESTTMGRILNKDDFGQKLKSFIGGEISENTPYTWGTCSGLIMLSNTLENQKIGGQYHIGGIDVTVSRNFFGRQVNSFEAPVFLNKELFNEEQCHGVFIRAPAVLSCNSPEVITLGTIAVNEISDKPVVVAVQQNNMLATAFHPELTENLQWHKHFLNMIISKQ